MGQGGITTVRYQGPADVNNRKRCASRVNRVFTVAMNDAMKNDAGPQPSKYFGSGWKFVTVFAPHMEDGKPETAIPTSLPKLSGLGKPESVAAARAAERMAEGVHYEALGVETEANRANGLAMIRSLDRIQRSSKCCESVGLRGSP